VFARSSIEGLFADVATRDFAVLWSSGQAWASGRDPYAIGVGARPNLNPPVVVTTMLAVAARWPLAEAARAWTLIGGCALAVSALVMVLRRQSTALQAGLAAVLLLLSYPAAHVWGEGQIVWLLMLPMTLAWLAYEEGADVRAGLWLAPVVVAKPFLLLMPLLLGATIVAWTYAGAVMIVAASAATSGIGVWLEWLSLRSAVTWFSSPANASIWGWLARMHGVGPQDFIALVDLPTWVWMVAITTAVVGAFRVVMMADPTCRWVGAGLLTIALAPLGWVYYLPLWAWPLASLMARDGRSSMWLWAGLPGLFVPQLVLLPQATTWAPMVTIGSMYWWSLFSLLVGTIGRGGPSSWPRTWASARKPSSFGSKMKS
jgi:hypothetical protein